MNDTITALTIGTIPATILTTITFILTRKKFKGQVKQVNAKAETNEIDNVAKVARIWRELSEDLKEKLSLEIDVLRKENSHMKNELNIVQEQFSKVLSENETLRTQMTSLQKELKASKSQIETLTSQNKNLLLELKKFNKNHEETSHEKRA